MLKLIYRCILFGFIFGMGVVHAQSSPTAESVKSGEVIYAKNCSTCHGARMKNPQWGFNLELFPVEQKIRFIDSVTYGKNGMPPWEDVLSAEDISNIWSYFLSLR
jgi:mono/diheme cytochrome c family protein